MRLTPDLTGGKLQLHEAGEWPIVKRLGNGFSGLPPNGAVPFCRSDRVATSQLSLQSAMIHLDIVLQLVEQEHLKGDPPFAAFLYDERLRKNWARRAEKGDPGLDIPAEAQQVDTDILDIARHRLSEVLKAAGLSEGAGASRGSASSMPASAVDEVLSRQSAASHLAQRQAERVTKQLADTQHLLLQQTQEMAAQAENPSSDKLTKNQLKSQKWFDKIRQRRKDLASKKKMPWSGGER